MKLIILVLLVFGCQNKEAASGKWKLFATREKMVDGTLPNSTSFATHSVDTDSEEACRKNATEFLYYQNHGEERPDFQYKQAICAFNCTAPEGLKEGFSLKEYSCQKVVGL
jgi:hypothetical protein